jgi:hypothetical protein
VHPAPATLAVRDVRRWPGAGSLHRGESAAHPNAARLSPATPGRVTFGEVLAAFPFASTGAAFHFRFQVTQDRATLFADLGALEALLDLVLLELRR